MPGVQVFETVVSVALFLLLAYLLAGVPFAIALHVRGLRAIDPAVEGGGWFFRLLITPGLVALWPVMVARWRDTDGGVPPEPPKILSAEGLRRAHGLLAPTIAVLAPLALALALYGRTGSAVETPPELPQPAPAESLLRSYTNPLPGGAIAALNVRRDAGGRLQIEVEVTGDYAVPGLALWWTARGGGESVLLGPVGGPGRHRFFLPERVQVPFGTLTFYDVGHGEAVGTLPLGD